MWDGGPSQADRPREDAQAKGRWVAAEDCFAERIDGTTAYQTVERPADGFVQAEILADRDDSHWC
jgi:hypothetical protein